MRKPTVIFLFCAVNLAFSADINIEKVFKENEIVPDVIDQAPEDHLNAEFVKSEKTVEFGNELTPKQVSEIPKVKYHAEQDAYYTLIMTDPDAPSRKNPIRREWNHWLVVNIPGSQIEKGQVLREYIGSAPPKDTGLHRYVFLVYRQPGKLEFDEPYRSDTDGRRGNFSAKKFAEKYHLGRPIAGNFYMAQYDDSVPAVHKRIKTK